MIYILCFVILWINSFFEFVFKNFKIKELFFVLSAAVLLVLQACNYWSPDILSYKYHYYNINTEEVKNIIEPIHSLLIGMNLSLGNSFEEFYFFYGSLIILILCFFLRKITPLPCLVIAVFYIIPFFPNIVQIRSSLGLSIFFIALLFFRRNNLVFITLYILAVLCHYSFLAILPFFILTKFPFFQDNRKVNIVILFLVTILSVIPKSILLPLVNFINPKFDAYLDNNLTFIGTVTLFLPFFILNSFVIHDFKKNVVPFLNSSKDRYSQIYTLIPFIQYANFLILMQYFIRDFSRITMGLSILSYIYISVRIFKADDMTRKLVNSMGVRVLLLLWALVAYFVNFLIINSEYYHIIRKTFESNYVLENLFFN